jgi:WD40 repeat protein/serine/threonine protein kinase
MAQETDLGTQERRTSSSSGRTTSSSSGRTKSSSSGRIRSSASGRSAPRTEISPGVSPGPQPGERTLVAKDAATHPVPRGLESTMIASPSDGVPPTSSQRLAQLAAQLPSVARELYVVGLQVAKGGIGRVLRARDQRLDRPVAIKELLVWNEAQEQRFVREALLTARLQHPAIVPIYEAGRWPNGEPFYAMKLVSGRSLAELIGEKKTLAERLSLLPHVITVAQAIAYAHSQHIIHRDLKPANVLVGEFGETVVIDWGLAKGIAENEDAAAANDTVISGEGLTIAGAVVGTPAYMPPEQAMGHPVDERADVYAIGAMLYHLLAAVPPYHEAPWEKLLATIAGEPPRALEKLAPAISDELSAIVSKAMARRPDDRYRTAKALADDLERFQTGQIVAAHTYSASQLLRRFWRRNRSALSMAAAALGLVALVVVGAFVKIDGQRRFAQEKQREAQEASLAAEAARKTAESAEQKATSRADEMTLLQANAALERDPNEAVAWLKTLSPGFSDVVEMRRIAADAQARGISRAYRGHTAYVNGVALLDDGKRILSASDDKTLRLWNTATAESIVLAGHTDEAWYGAALPDGKRVVSGSKDGTVRIWDAATGAQLALLRAPSAISQLVVVADGTILGCPRQEGVPWAWAPGATEARVLSEPSEQVASSFISGDGSRVLLQHPDGTAWLMDVASGRRRQIGKQPIYLAEWRLSYDGRVAAHGIKKGVWGLWDLEAMTSRALTPAGKAQNSMLSNRGDLYAVATDKGIWVYDTRTGALVRELPPHPGSVSTIAFSSDGRMLATGGFDRTVRTWDLTTGEMQSHAGLKGAVMRIEFMPDQRSVVAGSSAGDLRLFEPVRAGTILTDHRTAALGLAVSADGHVASISEAGRLVITDLAGKPIAEHALPATPNVRLYASPDRRRFAGTAFAWNDTADGRMCNDKPETGTGVILGTFDAAKPTLVAMPAATRGLAWRRDGAAVFVALADGTVRQIEWNGTLTEVDRLAAPVMNVAVSADGAQVAAGGDDGSVRLTELATGHHRDLGKQTERVLSLAFSPNGTWLASGSFDHTARLWRLDDGSFRSFDAGGHGVAELSFSADSKTLYLLSSGEMSLRLLETESGKVLPPITGHQAPILGFSFSDDGRRLLTRSLDRTARLIDVGTGKGRALRGHLGFVSGAELLPGNKGLVTLGYEGTVRAWPDDLPETVAELRTWIEAATPDRVLGP